MSETVERRLVDLLDHPTQSPYGNPIPGLAELGGRVPVESFLDGMAELTSVASEDACPVTIGRIAETLQTHEELLAVLHRVGAEPGRVVTVARTGDVVTIEGAGQRAELGLEAASHLFVRRM